MTTANLREEPVATEHSSESQLAELLSQEAGHIGEYELKVLRSSIVDYSYRWKGETNHTQKLVVLLRSRIPEQYCLGTVRPKKQDNK